MTARGPGDEAPERGERLLKSHDQVHCPPRPGTSARAARGAQHADAVRVVDQAERVVLLNRRNESGSGANPLPQ